jgi:hypothetical protein
MQRLVIVVPLAEGAGKRAAELLEHGPPFEPAATNLDRHGVYLTENEVVFTFDGSDVEWEVDDLADDSLPDVGPTIEQWRELLSGPPRIAREAYFWARASAAASSEAKAPPPS